MHAAHRFMWARAADGSNYEAVVTTLKNAHALHSSTHELAEAPLSGFVLGGTLYLDPKGAHCESVTGSKLTQRPAHLAFQSEYAGVGLLRPGRVPASQAQACVVSGRVIVGVTAAEATALSVHLLREASVVNPAWTRGNRIARPGPVTGGHVRRAQAGETPETVAAAASAAKEEEEDATAGAHTRGAAGRQLGKTPVAQSSGVRRVLVVRVVWRDENASVTMDDATYLAYASNFVSFANNRSYGNMVVVPTYTPGCVYNLPNHTAAQATLPANSGSVAGWIFGDVAYALALAKPACRYSASNFEHVFVIILNAPTVGWAGIGYQPGSTFIVQVGSAGEEEGKTKDCGSQFFRADAGELLLLTLCLARQQGGYGAGVAFHEFGHNLGLQVRRKQGAELAPAAPSTTVPPHDAAALEPVGPQLPVQCRVRRRHVHHGRRRHRCVKSRLQRQ